MKATRRFCGVAMILAALSPAGAVAALPLNWGDQGDGTYRNPVLNADYSDPDLVRVGDDFYLVASEFHFVGIQVLHSRDLVNWQIIGQVYDRLAMDRKYDDLGGYAQGTWAPSLRYRDGRFYLYVCTPRDGLYRWTAENPAGPWSDMVTIKTVENWEDPCPIWDDDGQAYLVHSLHGAGPLILHRMNAEGTQLLDDGVEIYRGPVAEGPKFYKRNGWYYISLPEGGVEKGGQTVLRAKAIYGPYERRVVLPDGSPHQGGIVELDNGESWFIAFKSAEHLGRVCHLLPVRWGEDDWPVFGDSGRAVEQGKKPTLPAGPIQHPQTSDDFAGAVLPPQWQWNHNPASAAWSLTERPGWLRLHGQPAPEPMLARNTLTQKIWGESGTVTVKLDPRGLTEGQAAGFAFMSGKVFNSVGVTRAHGKLRLYSEAGLGGEIAEREIRLRGTYHGAIARLHYSIDGDEFVDVGSKVTLRFGQWKGARVTLFAYGPGDGVADFDDFQYRHSTPVAHTN